MPARNQLEGPVPSVPPISRGTSCRLRWRQQFPGDGGQIGVMRRWMMSLLPQCPARDDAILIASELGTNAVRHTASGQGGKFGVEVTWSGSALRVAVADEGAPGGPRMTDDPLAESGRGLLVVRSLAVRTGARGDHVGRVVWADISWERPNPAPAAQDAGEPVVSDGG
jgi:anti-sigma regulatory factor (Ser/Thr protein kinase)